MPRTGLTPDQIREKAIVIAADHIRKHGFEKLKLTEVAREIGISHAALYTHFVDKSALFDIVSERWIAKIDEDLEAIVEKKKDPCELIHTWALYIHKAKLEKVLRDPELYKAFDFAAEMHKPFIQCHLKNIDKQINILVSKAIAKKKLLNADPKLMSSIIRAATVGFHHPKLVAQHLNENRETLLRDTLDAVLFGLRLKK